jgi:hypothetical protein
MAKMLINHILALLVHLIENADNNDFRKPTLATNGNTYSMSFTSLILKLYLKKIFLNWGEATIDEIIKVKKIKRQKDVVAITGKDKATISRHWNKKLTQCNMQLNNTVKLL